MNSNDPDWNLYRSFLAVAAEGSLSGAARFLRLTQPTVSRHIEALEAQLGATLFLRSQRGLALTAMAEEILPLARDMAATAAALRRASSGDARAERGVVSVTVSQMLSVEILPPILADFALAHPQIEIEFNLSVELLDLLRRDVDIAVRLIRPTQQALLARRLGPVEIGLYAHRSYVAASGLPEAPGATRRRRLIGFDQAASTLRVVEPLAEQLVDGAFSFRSDSYAAQWAALRHGAGVAMCPVLIADRRPDLVRLARDAFAVHRDVWLVMHEDARQVRRVRLLYDHLAERLTASLSA